MSLSFASSKGASIPRFNTTALTIVGVDPFHKLTTPSSLMIFLNASKKFL